MVGVVGCTGELRSNGSTQPDSGLIDSGPTLNRDGGSVLHDAGTNLDALVDDAAQDSGSTSDGGTTGCNDEGGANEDVLARGISVRNVTINQAVDVPVVVDGAVVGSRTAAVVAGRDALVQVFVQVANSWATREVVVRLNIGSSYSLQERVHVTSSSIVAAPLSSIRFSVPGSEMTQGVGFSVEIFEDDPCETVVVPVVSPRFPVSGTSPLGAEQLSAPLEVVLVPIRYDADASGRVPNLNENAVAEYRSRLMKMFPVDRLNMSVRAIVAFPSAIQASGAGWGTLLDECLSIRNSDSAAANVYYYCVFDPADSFAQYCPAGCVAGLGVVPSAFDTYNRAAIGFDFGSGAGTFVHEIGHIMGLPHAPCGGPDGVDTNYPHTGGLIGVYGYDFFSSMFIDPLQYRDVMTYCQPRWISDYNYDKVFTRLATVTAQSTQRARSSLVSRAYRSVVVDQDANMAWGSEIQISNALGGRSVNIEFLDANGEVLERSVGSFMPFTHVQGGTVYVPVPKEIPSAARIESFGVLSW